MPQLKNPIQIDLAHEFFTRSFTPGETLAVLLRGEYPFRTQQRIVRFECAIAPRYLRWLAYENARGANIYVAANPLRFGSRKRTKESIDEVRHLYIDIDSDGDARLAAIRTSDTVPIPSTILSTSPGKYQVLGRSMTSGLPSRNGYSNFSPLPSAEIPPARTVTGSSDSPDF